MGALLDGLGGAFVPLVTPLDGRGAVDLASLRKLVERVLAVPVDGLWVNGTSGEFHALDDEERAEALRCVVEAAGGRAPVVAHVGDTSTRRVARKVEAARRAGADWISSITPYFLSYARDEVKDHYRAIAASAGAPVLVYQHPMSGKPPLPVSDLCELIGERVVAGLKESSSDFEYFRSVLEATRDLPFRAFHGAGLHAHMTLRMGAAGMVSLIGNLLPRTCAGLFRGIAGQEGAEGHARRIEAVSRSIESALRQRTNWAPTLAAYRFLLRELGVFASDEGFAPGRPLSSAELEALREETLPLCVDEPLGGAGRSASSGWRVPRENPADLDEVVASYEPADPAAARQAMDRAAEGFVSWRRAPMEERLRVLERARRLLAAEREEFARTITLENGKLLREALAEVDGSLGDWDHQLAVAADATLIEAIPSRTAGVKALVQHEPRGVFCMITPWNFPLATIVRKLVPALAMGNTLVCKASELTPATAQRLFRLLSEAGLPPDAARLVLAEGAHVGPSLLQHEALRGVSFTGSTAVGLGIARTVGDRDVELQLEMGGKNALVVLRDADLERALDATLLAGYGCAGQWCTSTSRLLLDEPIHDRFLEALAARLEDLRLGDGLKESSGMGPLISRAQQARFREAVGQGRDEGGVLVAGGRCPDTVGGKAGYWAEPTVFRDVQSGSQLATEEVFGPLVAALRVDGPEHALEVARDTEYGLSFSVFTSSEEHARDFVEHVEAGLCHVNLPTPYREPALPLGGWGASGRGVPECGDTAIRLHTRAKSIYGKDIEGP